MEIKDHMPHAYARRLAEAVSRYLKKRYGARKVLLIGSLALGSSYNPDFSDIDVYFEGVQEELAASAVADCRRNFGQRDSGGRKRIDYISERELPAGVKNELIRSAEEI
jgi:predicted nucleotidyltransferase